MDNQIDNIEAEIHEHLEIDHGDVTTYVNVFDVKPGYIHVMIGKNDNSGKLHFNKLEMFLTEDQFQEFAGFFSNVNSKLYRRNSSARLEEYRQAWMEDNVKVVVDDTNHVDLQRPNVLRDIQDSNVIKTKMRNSRNYCVRFYGSLCNNQLLSGEYLCSYSWRSTGGLIADILGQGNYMDWYCSGGEGHIDDEVQEDLMAIGWQVVPYPEESDA